MVFDRASGVGAHGDGGFRIRMTSSECDACSVDGSHGAGHGSEMDGWGVAMTRGKHSEKRAGPKAGM